MHSLKVNSFKDLKQLMENKVYVVHCDDRLEEATDLLAAFKTKMGAKAYARATAKEGSVRGQSIEQCGDGYSVIEEGEEILFFGIKELDLNA